MSRKRTGLRNKFRHGRGTYSIKHKSRASDTYGTYQRGYQSGPDIIAGHILPLHVPQGSPANKAQITKRIRRAMQAEMDYN